MRHVSRPRPAFTLLELIVVLTIIALLAALTVSAVFRVQESQRESNTNIDIRKLQMGLDQQYKAAMDRIRTEDPPQAIKELTKTSGFAYDNTRARALHMKMRLRQEFPQSFAEADPAKFQAAYGTNLIVWSYVSLYPPKPAFSVVNLASDTPDNESAVLLYLILNQGRGGSEFNADGSVAVTALPMGGKNLKVCLDHWGDPIAFRRWADMIDDPTNLGVVAELSQPPFRGTGKVADMQDPDGRLVSPDWATDPMNGPNRVLAMSFFIPAGNVRPAFNQNFNPLDGFNRGPYVYSAGKDKQYGNENDLFGFRIQGSGKGN